MKSLSEKISIIAPCYNEEEVIDEFYRRIHTVCEANFQNYELLLVNDGSRDSTWSKIESICAKNPNVVGVNLARNFGHQAAVSAGLFTATGELTALIDADLQDAPELLPQMVKELQKGFDVVYGQRSKRKGETIFKKASAYFFYWLLSKLVDVKIPRDTGDFRIFNSKVKIALQSMNERYRFVRGMVAWVGFKQQAFLYERDARFAGETKYPFKKMLQFSLDAITSFSIYPLRLVFYLGFVSFMMSLAFIGYVLYRYYMEQTVHGWASMMVVITLISGSQFFAIGLIGEYVGRTFMEVKARPHFLIAEVLRN